MSTSIVQPGPSAGPLVLACMALACAMVCSPGSPGRARLSALAPRSSAARRHRGAAAGLVAGGAAIGFVVAGPAGALAGALITVLVRHRRRSRLATTAAGRSAEQLADALGRIGDELRTGSHPAAALAGLDADGPRARTLLAHAATAAELGDDVAAALRRTATEHPEVAGDLTRMASAWSLAAQYGVPLAELFSGAQVDLQWRTRFAATVRAQLAGPRATASVLTCLPLLGVALGQLLGADPIGVLRAGLVGQVLVVVGIGAAATGWVWSDHIVRTAVPR